MPETLHLRQFVPRGLFYHVARTHFSPRTPRMLHTHDFVEVFWLEAGRGEHQINGEREPIDVGDVVFIRAADVHAFRAVDRAGLTLTNIAFACDALSWLRRRHFRGDTAWPWRKGAMPLVYKLGAAKVNELATLADRLAGGEQTAMNLDWFALSLLRLVQQEQEAPADGEPLWLREAIVQFQSEALYVGGPAALAEVANRSIEHLNRVVRAHRGTTTTDLVNALRLDRAAMLLRMTSQPIVDVAANCGFENLGYFYRLFNARHAMTPRRYRLQAQGVA